ncbi:CLUMA_CG021491, isoform A [Clunio marinus]|uniref:CLUMA_CG021491, isoform A n=1 Tax=Clunio marinus TaxID=568069 RepID=A0A1J1J8Y9_9DIPT|nr:CLUMA_CG021491, isoform A [Clunio marinus]
MGWRRYDEVVYFRNSIMDFSWVGKRIEKRKAQAVDVLSVEMPGNQVKALLRGLEFTLNHKQRTKENANSLVRFFLGLVFVEISNCSFTKFVKNQN